MSIRTNPMKAVPLLLRRLSEVRAKARTMEKHSDDEPIDNKLGELNSQLNNIKGLFSSVKEREVELLDNLTELDGLLRNFNEKEFRPRNIVDRIKKSANKLQQNDDQSKTKASDPSRQTSRGVEDDKGQEMHRQLSLSKHKNESVDHVLKSIQVSYDNLNLQSRVCLLSLSVFPENAVIKKRPSIYWWIGEGFVVKKENKTAEEVGECIFDELLKCELIIPYGNGKCPLVNKFQIHPWIRHMLVSLSVSRENDHQLFGFYSQITSSNHNFTSSRHALVLDQKNVIISDEGRLKSDNFRTIFNVEASYVSFRSQWSARMKKLMVLQLGRWQDSTKHHIEVENGEFLEELRTQKHLKYLSLRGISRISELSPSIVELVSLEILDLKACHNLETLPTDIASLRSLTHLDVSQCYLLESMPKGLEKLTELQVLKGFVIGTSNKTPTRISDLARLSKLKRLSIHIGSEAMIQDSEFEKLKDLLSVQSLKISWGANTQEKEVRKISFSFPPNLEKLDLEGFPESFIPKWLKPSNLTPSYPRLKKLYIKGGKLKKLDHGETGPHEWQVEILHLKYLKDLNIDLGKVKKLFPSLRYVQNEGTDPFEWTQ